MITIDMRNPDRHTVINVITLGTLGGVSAALANFVVAAALAWLGHG